MKNAELQNEKNPLDLEKILCKFSSLCTRIVVAGLTELKLMNSMNNEQARSINDFPAWLLRILMDSLLLRLKVIYEAGTATSTYVCMQLVQLSALNTFVVHFRWRRIKHTNPRLSFQLCKQLYISLKRKSKRTYSNFESFKGVLASGCVKLEHVRASQPWEPQLNSAMYAGYVCFLREFWTPRPNSFSSLAAPNRFLNTHHQANENISRKSNSGQTEEVTVIVDLLIYQSVQTPPHPNGHGYIFQAEDGWW